MSGIRWFIGMQKWQCTVDANMKIYIFHEVIKQIKMCSLEKALSIQLQTIFKLINVGENRCLQIMG